MSSKIRVAIIGVGNCASSLVQGVFYYHNAKEGDFIPGLMHVNLGGYHVRDIEFSAAFDIDKNKVGKDLSEAIFTKPNNTYQLCKVPNLKVKVERGMTRDGLGFYLSKIIQKAPGPTADIVKILKDTGTDVVVNYLPVGSEEATKWYVEQVLDAGCGFVNCIPVFIAREAYWRGRLAERGPPLVRGDAKAQGAPAAPIHIGPSDYVPWLADRKWAHIRLEGRGFGDQAINIELKLEVWDSPN